MNTQLEEHYRHDEFFAHLNLEEIRKEADRRLEVHAREWNGVSRYQTWQKKRGAK